MVVMNGEMRTNMTRQRQRLCQQDRRDTPVGSLKGEYKPPCVALPIHLRPGALAGTLLRRKMTGGTSQVALGLTLHTPPLKGLRFQSLSMILIQDQGNAINRHCA
jgi:hypothetical protein